MRKQKPGRADRLSLRRAGGWAHQLPIERVSEQPSVARRRAKIELMSDPAPAFATNRPTAAYYEQRAPEYDDWYEATGEFAARPRPGWAQEVQRLCEFVGSLPPVRTLDVACGTGFLTRHLRGLVIALDQSSSMVTIAQQRLCAGVAIVGDALQLPFADNAFDRVFTGHFYGHLPDGERAAFLAEARRVASELIVVDTARRDDRPAEHWEPRQLNDGSRHLIYKRYLSAEQLAQEIGGQPMIEGHWFVAARADLNHPRSRRS
jgi:demethylmenaquinone methyltransferase/2-methoxy-6-polyprenyl-1,4-benzoquinol methylase